MGVTKGSVANSGTIQISDKKCDERDLIEADLKRYKDFFATQDFEFEEFYKRLVPPALQTDAWREEFEKRTLESQ